MKLTKIIMAATVLLLLPNVMVAQNIEVFPQPSWDFGGVDIGDTATKTFTITSTSVYIASEIYAVNITVDSSDAFSLIDPPASGSSLDPDEWLQFGVIFAPSFESNDFTANLRIESTDLRHPDWDILLTGQSPAVVPKPSSLSLLGIGAASLITSIWRRRQ